MRGWHPGMRIPIRNAQTHTAAKGEFVYLTAIEAESQPPVASDSITAVIKTLVTRRRKTRRRNLDSGSKSNIWVLGFEVRDRCAEKEEPATTT